MREYKMITVTLQVRELVYDIQNKAFLTGQAREAEGVKGYEAASYMQASDDPESSYQIRRSLTNAFSALKSLMGEYLSERKTTSSNILNSEIDDDKVLTLSFEMPGNYNEASADSLANSVHAYLVDSALGEWFEITNREDAQMYISHAAMSLENVKRALYKRVRPKRLSKSE